MQLSKIQMQQIQKKCTNSFPPTAKVKPKLENRNSPKRMMTYQYQSTRKKNNSHAFISACGLITQSTV